MHRFVQRSLKNISYLFFKNKLNFSISSSTTKLSEDHPGILALRKQSWYEDYMSATNDFAQKNFSSALQIYYKIIQTMQSSNQKGQAYYYKIFQKILQINVLMNRPLETEQNLYKLIKTRKQLNKNPILVYENYHDLMIHQLQNNVEKAIKLGKALLSESQINNLPINIEKSIRMLLGNGYLLMDNIPDAKQKYAEVLQMKPNHMLKGLTMNNLAIACWWHKNPLFKISQLNVNNQIAYDEVRINRDFKQTKELLMNSIGAIENIEELSEGKANLLESLLNEITETMIQSANSSKENNKNSYIFEHKHSLRPIFNLIQYYIYNDPIQKPLILAWMRILIKNAAHMNVAQVIDETTPKYYLLNGDIPSLKEFLMNTLRIKKIFNDFLNSNFKLSHVRDQKQIANLVQLLKLYFIVKQAPYSPQNENKNVQLNKQIGQKLKNLSSEHISSLQSSILSTDANYFKRQFILSEELSFMRSYNNRLNLSQNERY